MTLRAAFIGLAAVAIVAPAHAQATPEATMARFIELANTGKLTTPAGQALLTGEARAMATDAVSSLPAADRILPAGPDKAVARLVLKGSQGDEGDAYFYLEKSADGWRVSAYRAMAMSGLSVALLNEMKKRPRLSEQEQHEKRNLELVLSPDSKLRAWFTANKPALDALAQTWLSRPAPRKAARNTEAAPAIGASLPALGFSAIEDRGDGVLLTIGGMLDNTVGFYRAGPSGPPPVSPSEFIWVEDVGGGWYLFRTT